MNRIIPDKTAKVGGIVAEMQLADLPTAFSRVIQVKVYGARVYLLVTSVIARTSHAATGGRGGTGRCTKLGEHCMVYRKNISTNVSYKLREIL